MRSIIIIGLLALTYCGRTVYMCHDDPFKDEQCMKREVLGSNIFYWVRKCKGAKVCVNLPYYNQIIGACSIKVRSHYDGESCANGNKCTSGICGGTKCKGLNPDVKCQVGLGQCQKGYLCRDSKCQKPIDNGKACGTSYSDTPTPTNSGYTIYSTYYFNPSRNPCKLNYVCSRSSSSTSTPVCTEIGSQANGITVDNPLACSSGFAVSGKCATASDGTTYGTTAKGGDFKKISNITTAFNKWKDEWKKKSLKDEDAIYEAYRYTKNKKKINEYFYQYVYAPFVADADECAYDFMWKLSSSNSLKFSLMILILALLF